MEEWHRGMSFACFAGLDIRLRESGRRSSTYPHKHRGSPPQRFSIGAAVPPLWVERARVAREFCTGGGCYPRPNRGSGTRRSLGRLGSCIVAPPLTGGLCGLALFLRDCGKKVIVGEEDAGHVAQQLLLPMFLSEPGGVSGRRRIGIHATRFPETPPETFGGFFVDMFPGSKGHRVFPRGGLFCREWAGPVAEGPETQDEVFEPCGSMKSGGFGDDSTDGHVLLLLLLLHGYA